MSLVLQVLDAYQQYTIIKLKSTYAALPLPLVTQRTSPNSRNYAETAQYVAMMISRGQLNATLEKKTQDLHSWVLRFASSSGTGPHARSEKESYEELVSQAATTAKLAAHVRETDRKLSLSKEYINWMKQSKKDTESSANGGEDPLMMPGQFEDEDIMGDG